MHNTELPTRPEVEDLFYKEAALLDEWRRVQRAEGYHAITINGDVTFEDGRCTSATPGRLLRHGG